MAFVLVAGFLGVFVVLTVWEINATKQLAAFRTDIRAGENPLHGSAVIPGLNQLNPANYSPEGRRRLKRFALLEVARLVAMSGAVIVLIRSFL